MNRFLKGLVVVGLFACAPSIFAQWYEHPEQGLPRKPDGRLNVDAPTPRLPNGKPDLSGLWKVPSGAYGANLGKRTPGGAAPLQAWARELLERRVARARADDPASLCKPTGLIGSQLYSIFKIYPTPKAMVVLFELSTTFRQIFLDGRAFPEDPQPSFMGYSVGRWDGDTLVVETTGFNGKAWPDGDGHPTTEKLRLTERFKRPSFGRLEIEMTVDDPGAYTKPWTVVTPYDYVPDSELMEQYCEDNRFAEQLKGEGIQVEVEARRPSESAAEKSP